MARYVTAVNSPWTAQHAFDYLSNLEHFADWDPGVTRAVRADGPLSGVGAAYDVSVKTAFATMTLRYVTEVYDAPRRIEVCAQTASLRSYDVMTIDDRGDEGCLVTYTAALDLRGVRAVGNPLLSIAFKGIGDRAAAGLRRALEGTAALT